MVCSRGSAIRYIGPGLWECSDPRCAKFYTKDDQSNLVEID